MEVERYFSGRYEGETFTVVSTNKQTVIPIIEEHHGYGTAPPNAVYYFAVIEKGEVTAAFTWNVPVAGVAKMLGKGALCLTRMVAKPRSERSLRHISKPLRFSIKRMIDRDKYPILVTYSDLSMGHDGYTYKCAGFRMHGRGEGKMIVTSEGKRKASVSSGKSVSLEDGDRIIKVDLIRWVHGM